MTVWTYRMVKAEIEAIDKQIRYFRERRSNVAANCTHDEIENDNGKSEHFYCLACGAHVGDIDGLWGPNVDQIAFPYIKDDDPRIVNRDQA